MERIPSPPPAFDAHTLIPIFWKWRWLLLTALLIAATAAWGITKLIPPRFESHAILLPSNSNSRDKQLEEFTYGFEVHSERLIQLLQSESLLDSVETRFQLAAQWDIPKTDPAWYTHFRKKAADRIRFHKTQHAGVVVSVADEKPERAAAIANDIAKLVNIVNADIVKANALEVLRSVEAEFSKRNLAIQTIDDSITTLMGHNTQATLSHFDQTIRDHNRLIDRLRDSIDHIRTRYNIFDFGYQVNVLNEQLAQARSEYLQATGALEILKDKPNQDTLLVRTQARQSGAHQRVKFFEQQLHELSTVNETYTTLLDRLNQEVALLANTREERARITQPLEPIIDTRNLKRMERELDFDQIQLKELQRKYQTAMSNYLDPVPVAVCISPARPSYEKVYPKTLLSIILASLGTLLTAALAILILEQLPRRRGA